MPRAFQHTTGLECPRTTFAPVWKFLATGSLCYSSTKTSLSVVWQFWTTLSPCLFLIGSDFHPLGFLWVYNIHPSTSFFSFRAKTIKSYLLAFPIHLFVPLRRYPFSVFVEVVFRFEASDPILSSVNAHPPIQSMFITFGKYFAFCAYDPKVSMVYPSRPACTRKAVANPGSILVNYAIMIPCFKHEVPTP